MRTLILLCLSIGAAIVLGCQSTIPAPPSTQPAMTAAQQQQIAAANTIMATTDAANEIDTLVGQYDQAVAGGTSPGTLLADIRADETKLLATIAASKK